MASSSNEIGEVEAEAVLPQPVDRGGNLHGPAIGLGFSNPTLSLKELPPT